MRFRLQSADLSFVDRAPIVNRQQVTLDAPPAAVWPAFADASAWVEWWADMRECRYTSDEPIGAGSTRSVRVASLRVDEELLAVEAATRYAFRVVGANVPFLAAMVEDVQLAPDEGGARTVVTYTQAVGLRRWASPLRAPFERQLRTALTEGLAGLPGWLAVHR